MASSEHDYAKELARKLYWAVSSTFPLNKQQRSTTFTWAADMADRIIQRGHPSRPPSVDTPSSNGYAGQADGRGGGRDQSSIQRAARGSPPPNMPAWEREQAEMRHRAWAYVLESRVSARQLPIPGSVYREVGNGRINSTG